jgi:hypothetical protein
MGIASDDRRNGRTAPLSPKSVKNPKGNGWVQQLGPNGRNMKTNGVPRHVREERDGLSQLSDLSADLLEQHNREGVHGNLSQELYNEQTQLPSQPDIPVPPLFVTPGCSYDAQPPGKVSESSRLSSRNVGRGRVGPGVSPAKPTRFVPVVQERESPPQAPKSKATRRGPMDEMRQLIRILVKVIPQSLEKIGMAEEGGGGNRISEDQIKSYLENTLGEAPRPPWGIPQGWGKYLAGLPVLLALSS